MYTIYFNIYKFYPTIYIKNLILYYKQIKIIKNKIIIFKIHFD